VTDWTMADVRRAVAAGDPRRLEVPGHGRAAILVPVLDDPGGPALLLTVRAAGLARHAGQIAFPGGRVEDGEDAVRAALREALEEVGLRVDPGDVFGALDDRVSPFGLVATPIVARVSWPAALRLDAGEVAEAFVVPLALFVATPPVCETRWRDGRATLLHRYEVAGRSVWGLTGNVVKDLMDRLTRHAPVAGAC